MKRGFILKADINRMVLTGGEDLDKIDQLAFDFFKAIEAPPAISANCGLAAFGFGEAE